MWEIFVNTGSLWNICVTNDHGYVPLVAKTSRSFRRSWLVTGFVSRLTRMVRLVELLTLPEHLSSPPVFSGIRVTGSLVLCLYFIRSLFVLLATMLSVLLRYTESDYPFGIFKLFLQYSFNIVQIFGKTIISRYTMLRLSNALY